ncbi:MAG: DUF2946 family protein [Burkholderiaceae bacterium]|jgi:hypothetical protein|nr:DUF2946 family protein [Burkholderiaceae bacterium]
MDADVLAALVKWPNVPAVIGWLSLTARGDWRLRGEPIGNAAIRAFIGRNYAADPQGRWFFQNGPQRVYVTLDATPWVWRIAPDGRVGSHTGACPARCEGAALLDDGRLLLVTDLGPGLIDDRDSGWALRVVTDVTGLPLNEQGLERWMDGKDEAFVQPARLHLSGAAQRILRLSVDAVPARYGFVREPQVQG